MQLIRFLSVYIITGVSGIWPLSHLKSFHLTKGESDL